MTPNVLLLCYCLLRGFEPRSGRSVNFVDFLFPVRLDDPFHFLCGRWFRAFGGVHDVRVLLYDRF